ncbi:MAG TPA: hypothetical protein DCX32_03470 [Candidatus Moranbacteria bacterium]|nr:MAG: hypothetical protein UW95_C0024G0008 [Parcubacteria group bacterium GW2011_GWC1_45_14]HAV11577.1 hypothetical protein [Candidatus Moranbacteria bacterium]
MEDRQNKIKVVTMALFIVANLIAFKLFPTEGRFQDISALIVFFVITPVLFNKFILKKDFSLFGLVVGDWKNGLVWAGLSLLMSFLIFYIIFHYTSFLDNYIISRRIAEDFLYFVYYELVLVLSLSFIYEFFFRGFVMFQFLRFLGYGAVLLQFLIFVVLIWFSPDFSWNFIPYIIFFPFAGLVAFKSNSIIYSLVAQSFFIFIVDVIFIRFAF